MNSELNIFNCSARRYEPDAGMFLRITNKDNQPQRTQRAQRFVLFPPCPLCALWFIFIASMEKFVICIIAPETAAGGRAIAGGRVGVGGKERLWVERNGNENVAAWWIYNNPSSVSEIYFYEDFRNYI